MSSRRKVVAAVWRHQVLQVWGLSVRVTILFSTTKTHCSWSSRRLSISKNLEKGKEFRYREIGIFKGVIVLGKLGTSSGKECGLTRFTEHRDKRTYHGR